MKVLNIFKISTCILAVMQLLSCSDEGFSDTEISFNAEGSRTGLATSSLIKEAQVGQSDFVCEQDAENNSQTWINDEIVYQMTIDTDVELSQISSIDFYVRAQEKAGYNEQAPYDEASYKINTINQWNSDGQFTWSVTADEIYTLFAGKFEQERSEVTALEGDLFEFYWMMYGANGQVVDSRNLPQESKYFSASVEIISSVPPIFAGTFIYTWIDATDNAINDGGIVLDDPQEITFESLGNQQYHIPNLGFDYVYTDEGTLTYDDATGEISLNGSTSEHWEILEVNGATLTIYFSYEYTEEFDESGTLTLTRTDGQDWPDNIFSN